MEPGVLRTAEWPGGSVLIHGQHNAGKTRLMLDALAYYSKQGKVLCANFLEEDGLASGANLRLDAEDLGYQAIWNLSDEPCKGYEDFEAFIELCRKEKPLAIGIDSLRAAYNAVLGYITKGEERTLKGGDKGDNEWSRAHMLINRRMTQLRHVAKYVVVTCPSDTGRDILKKVESGIAGPVKVVPDLNGSMAQKCITWFNLVGYLSVDSVKQGLKYKTIRTLNFAPTTTFEARQRMPVIIDDIITIPDNTGLWEAVLKPIEAAYKKGTAQ